MAYGLPTRGQADWDDEVNNSVEAVKSTADSALANANSAQSNANEARQVAYSVKDFVEGPTDTQIATKVAEAGSFAQGAVDDRVDLKVDPIRDLSDTTFANNLSASTAEGIADDGYVADMTPREAAELRTLRTVPNPLRRSVLLDLPFKFPGYSTVVTAKGYTYLWPQAMQYHGDHLFILYGATTGSAASGTWVSVHDATTGAYVSGFSTDADSYGEGLVIRDEAGVTNLYTRKTAGVVGRYDITTLPADQDTLAAAQTYSVDLFSTIIDDGNGGFLVQRSAGGVTASYPRHLFRRYDATLSTPGADVTFDPADLWSVAADLLSKNLKAQSITRHSSGYAIGYGSAYTLGGTPAASKYVGVRLLDPHGRPVASGICNPDDFAAVLTDAGHTVEIIENEGLCQYGDELRGLWVTIPWDSATAATTGILITREMVGDLDFTSAAQNPPALSAVAPRNGTIAQDAGGVRNPITGDAFTTLEQVIEFMRDAHLTRYGLYTTGTSLTDINGAAIPSGAFLEITVGNYLSWLVTVTSASGTERYWITGAEGSLTQARVPRTSAGTKNVTVTAAASASAAITFPSGLYSSQPRLVCTARSSGTEFYVVTGGLSASGATITVVNRTGASTTTTVAVDWVAHPDG